PSRDTWDGAAARIAGRGQEIAGGRPTGARRRDPWHDACSNRRRRPRTNARRLRGRAFMSPLPHPIPGDATLPAREQDDRDALEEVLPDVDLVFFAHRPWEHGSTRSRELLRACSRSRRVFYLEAPRFDGRE